MTIEATHPPQASTEAEPTPVLEGLRQHAAKADEHAHRTPRHVATHAGIVVGGGTAAAIAHVAGVAVLGATAGGAAVLAGGAIVVAKGRKGRARPAAAAGRRPAPRVRERAARTSAASTRRTAAGLHRERTRATPRARAQRATAARRGPGATGATSKAATRRPVAAGLRRGSAATVRRRATGGSATRPGAGATSGRTRRVVRSRRPRNPAPRSNAPRAAAAAPKRRPAPAPAPARAAPKRTRRRAATRRDPRITRPERATARRATTARAATARPSRPAAPRQQARRRPGTAGIRPPRPRIPAYRRRAARAATRHSARAYRFFKEGAKASKPYLRLRPPAEETAAAPIRRKPAPPAKKPTKTGPRRAVHPGRAVTAPGQTPKGPSTVSDITRAPHASMAAAAEAVDNLANTPLENITDVGGILAGIHPLFASLGASLSILAERVGDGMPVDGKVADYLREVGAGASSLAEWGTEAVRLFEVAHVSELQRLDNPRTNEQAWDVQSN